jgi:hypothetical protein
LAFETLNLDLDLTFFPFTLKGSFSMKKLLCIAVLGLFMVGVSGCGDKDTKTTTPVSPPSSPKTTPKA